MKDLYLLVIGGLIFIFWYFRNDYIHLFKKDLSRDNLLPHLSRSVRERKPEDINESPVYGGINTPFYGERNPQRI